MKKHIGNLSKLSLILVIGLIFGCQNKPVKKDNELTLWYQQPARKWTEALPIGNGRLGAMIFGGIEKEHLQLNESTVWAGEPGNNIDPRLSHYIPQLRKLISQGKYKKAQELANEAVPPHPVKGMNYGMPYQPVGDFYLTFPTKGRATNYRRALDIGNATSSVSYEIDGVQYKREYFASLTDSVIEVHLTASRPKSISFTMHLNSSQIVHKVYTKEDRLFLTGKSGDVANKKGKVRFVAEVGTKLNGGKLVSQDSIIKVVDANEATLYISMASNFKNYHDISGDAAGKASRMLASAMNVDYAKAKASHIQKYKDYFDRVSLSLGGADSMSRCPTNVRLDSFAHYNDLGLVSLYFQFGRYLLISSSQPHTQSANLQGIWNKDVDPAWGCKYTININTEMNYWPAEETNLAEMQQPLFSMINDLSVTGKQGASEIYHARGWVVHHNTDIWRMTGPIDGAYYGLWPMGGAWLSQSLWRHYLYDGDSSFVAKEYPEMKGLAQFYIDVLQKEPTHGWLVVNPSMSPEHAHENKVTIAAGTTMDNQLVFDVMNNAIHAAKLLHTDSLLVDTMKQIVSQLPPMQIGRWGQLQEWMEDWDKQGDHHRHVSHLYGLYPSNQISPYRTPMLFQAAKTSLISRGDVSTGWSMGWKVNLWARLLDGDHAFKLIKDQLRPSVQPDGSEWGGTYFNLFDAHPPFQIDGNFGCTSGIAQMLLQSQDGAIHILPALPTAWSKGEVKGLKAQGGFMLDIDWANGKPDEVDITSNLGGNCRIRSYYPLQGEGLTKAEGENPNPFFEVPVVKKPIISPEAHITKPELKPVFEYDLKTVRGGKYVVRLAKQ
jgi:alpha-L-fucosidase 2